MSTQFPREVRYDRFTLGTGMLGWLYEYENRVPRHKRGLASGLELGVQLDGEWLQRGSRAGAHAYVPGTVAPLSPGERYDLTVHAPSGRGSQVGFIVYPEEVPELVGETGSLMVAEGVVRDARLSALALDIRRAIARHLPGHEMRDAALESQTRAELMRFVRASCVLRPASPVLQVKRYLDRNVGSALFVAHLAEMAGMSERTFLRRFKQEVGLAPVRYRLLLRLNEAARLTWAEPGCGVQEIAARVGFDDLPYFHRAFREVFAMTPAAYGRRSSPRSAAPESAALG